MTTAANQYRALVAKLEAIQETSSVFPSRNPGTPAADAAAEPAKPVQSAVYPSRNAPARETGMDTGEPAGDDEMLVGDKTVEECGMDAMSMHSPQSQQDSVTMNVTANGAGGIRDLMDILRSLEGGHDDSHADSHTAIAMPFEETQEDGGFQSAQNGADNTQEFGIDAVTQTGNDLSSKGEESEKVNGGGNPMHEALVQQLMSHYQSIRES